MVARHVGANEIRINQRGSSRSQHFCETLQRKRENNKRIIIGIVAVLSVVEFAGSKFATPPTTHGISLVSSIRSENASITNG